MRQVYAGWEAWAVRRWNPSSHRTTTTFSHALTLVNQGGRKMWKPLTKDEKDRWKTEWWNRKVNHKGEQIFDAQQWELKPTKRKCALLLLSDSGGEEAIEWISSPLPEAGRANKAAYLSRISNKVVLQRAAHVCATDLLLQQQQLKLLGKALRSPTSSPLHSATVKPGTPVPATAYYTRRVGRPRKEWAPAVLGEAHRRNNSGRNLLMLARDENAWNLAVGFLYTYF